MRRLFTVTVLTLVTACGGSSRSGETAGIDATSDGPVTIDDAAPLPAGACYTSADCGESRFCQWAPEAACGLDHGIGTCVPLGPHFCSDLLFAVCGCDGRTYTNECHSAAIGVAVDYGGPCRAPGVFIACQTTDDCPFDPEFPQYCVDDPRDTCDPAAGTCPGVCVHGAYVCSATQPCLSQTQIGIQESPGTEACMQVMAGSDADPTLPGHCIDTTRQKCSKPGDCGAGELCMPELGCDPATTSCPSDCVRP